MPQSEVWPYEANTITDERIQFKAMTLTVREYFSPRDGTSKAGNEYHLPPRVSFEEDIEREEWSWKVWDDSKGSFEDYSGVQPVPGDIVQAKLTASAKKTGDGYYMNVNDISITGRNTNLGDSNASAAGQPAPPSGGARDKSALGMIPLEQRIAATAMTNTLLLQVFMETEDGDSWKETIREAVKKVALAQVPPTLLPAAQAQAQEQKKAAAPPQQEAPPEEMTAPPSDDDVEELPW
jgi:hypothetical protein